MPGVNSVNSVNSVTSVTSVTSVKRRSIAGPGRRPPATARKRRSEGESVDLSGPRVQQAIGSGLQCMAGREDVVDEPDPGFRLDFHVDAKRPTHVLASRGSVQTGLGGGRAGPHQPGGMARTSPGPGQGASDPLGLVEAADSSPARMEGDGQDPVRCLHVPIPQSAGQLPSQESDHAGHRRRRAEGAAGRTFEAGQPDAQGTFVPQQGMAGMQRRSVGETAGAAVGAGFEQTRLGGGTEGHAAAAARAAIGNPPPRQPSQAGAAERPRVGVGCGPAADAARG